MKTRNKVLIGGAVVVIAYLLWNRNKKKSNLTATNVSSGAESSTPTNESSNLDLPSGMDLPNLTPSTNVPTEVAIQESINVVPTPAIVESKPTDTESALNNSLIIPIPKVTAPIAETPSVQAPEVVNSGNLKEPVLIPALPSVEPSISPIEKIMELISKPTPEVEIDNREYIPTPNSQYIKEMLPVYEGGYNKGGMGNNSSLEIQMY
jgi:hypothetical protein